MEESGCTGEKKKKKISMTVIQLKEKYTFITRTAVRAKTWKDNKKEKKGGKHKHSETGNKKTREGEVNFGSLN